MARDRGTTSGARLLFSTFKPSTADKTVTAEPVPANGGGGGKKGGKKKG